MKRTLHLSSLILLALGCAQNPVQPPPAGGQSGDDGDVVPEPPGVPPPQPIPPGIPDFPCEPEETEHTFDATTAFGGSARDLLSRIAPSQDSPLFWVPFDSLSGTTFTPAASQATLTLTLSERSAGTVKQMVWRPKAAEATCQDDTLQVPVRVSVRTSDGAFDEQVDSLLELTSANTAHLGVELPSTLAGSFAFDQIGPSGEDWQLAGFNLDVDLWSGGSRGEIFPSFTRAGPPSAPSTPSAAPPPLVSGAPIPGPAAPSHWRAIAVWPQRENCDAEPRGQATAHGALDRVIGWSTTDIVNDLNARSESTLSTGQGTAPVQFTIETPTGMQCVRASGRSMTFDVLATLRAQAAQGSPLEHLAASSVFELTATAARDGSGLERLRWVRRDVVAAQSRTAFEAATGLALNAPDQYQQVWWSWHGSDTRASTADPWVIQGQFVVSSLNAAQSAEIARVVAQGGPGAGISFDGTTQFPKLPGDPLIDASIAP